MVDDLSTDKSGQIIDQYAFKFDNFKAIHLSENSGAAGKPRNVGIDNSSGEYLMFLDPDDYYVDDACEILYEKIFNENADIVFGKYDVHLEAGNIVPFPCQLYSSNVSELKSNNVNELIKNQIHGAPPSIWTKIFKRNFIKDNHIHFPEGIPAQDLVFFVEALLKANEVIFINKTVVNYRKRNTKDKSISFNVTERYLLGLAKSYKLIYKICKDNNNDKYFSYQIQGHLNYWIRQFIISDTNSSEKINVLNSSWCLFKKFHDYNLTPLNYLAPIFESIFKKDFNNVILLTNGLADTIRDEMNIPSPVKNQKKIFILCDKLPVELGGLAKIVLHRSKFLAEKHDVTILTILPDNDSDSIQKELIKNGLLSPSVKLINIYTYYKNKNTLKESFKSKSIREMSDGERSINEEGYQISNEYKTKRITHYFKDGNYKKRKNWNKDGTLNFIDYFDENNMRFKRNLYDNGFLTKEISYSQYRVRRTKYFTKDGFCYLNEQFNFQGSVESYFLFDRFENTVHTFSDINDFHKQFLTELCMSSEEKPYLICDGSGPTPTISNIDPEIAYLISNLHSNPYIGSHSFGEPIRDIGVLKDIEKNDAFITLTEQQRGDIVKQFGDFKNTFTIPNFVINEQFNEGKISKKSNKISIFSRISPEKNLSDAINSFKLVVNERKDAKLEIFGRATLPRELEELKKIQKLIKKLQLESNISIKGYCKYVYKEMSESAATLLTSTYEGFGMVIIESMLNSTPVISYDINYGPSELIDHGVNGFLVEAKNIKKMAGHILEILNDFEKAKKMGTLARKKVLKCYTHNVVIPMWETLFETVSNENKPEFKLVQSQLDRSKIQLEISNKLIKEKEMQIKQIQVQNEMKEKKVKELETSQSNHEKEVKELETLQNNHENEIKELNNQIYSLKQRLDEIENNNKQQLKPSLRHKFISKFPMSYILYKNKYNGLINTFYHIKGYNFIKKNNLMDMNYYLENNPDVKLAGIDPILHYFYHGINEGRKFRQSSQGNYLKENHEDVLSENLNPLLFYISKLNKNNETSK